MEKEVEELVEQWDATSFFKLDRKKRWAIIKDVRRQYETLVVKGGQERAEAHDAARVERLKAKSEDHVAKVQGRCLKYAEFDRVAPCTTLDALAILATGDAKKCAEALRDQIRLRLHVYFVPKSELPLIGDGDGAGEVERLASSLQAVVATPLLKKPPPPIPYPVRPAHPAPTSGAVALDIEHVHKISAAIAELMSMTAGGVIKATRSSAPRRRAAPAAARPPSRKRSAPGASLAPRAPTPAQASLVGEGFVEDHVEWKVLMAGWCCVLEEIVVWYYDVEMAIGAEISEEEMEEARMAGELLAPVEVSGINEVKKWIREHNRG